MVKIKGTGFQHGHPVQNFSLATSSGLKRGIEWHQGSTAFLGLGSGIKALERPVLCTRQFFLGTFAYLPILGHPARRQH